ncbi:hypothetical protein R8Z50_04935 [Longispora sp. K20-0274]|uniref:hypothetical protein n=1 Tax=Longispora sp. K20-0274 TaxID=3088255 RepID=UPI00399B3F50
MGEWVPAAMMVAVYVGVAAGLAWLALRVRRRGISSPALGVFDEIYRPTAAESRIEIQIQAEWQDPTETPDRPTRPDQLR